MSTVNVKPVMEPPRAEMVDPKRLEIPDVRITAAWDPDMLAMFKQSISTMGIREAVVVLEDGEHLWIVDGQHRRDEALLKGIPQVLCAISKGTLKDVYLQNIALSHLKGHAKASETAKVIRQLIDVEKVTEEDIQKRTGLKRDYIEKMLAVSRIHPEILQALDDEKIGVGHCYELSRIGNLDVQLKLYVNARQYDMKIGDLRTVVDETLKLLEPRPITPGQAPPAEQPRTYTIKCHFCEEERPINLVRGWNICQPCFAIAYGAVQDHLNTRKAAAAPPAPVSTGNTGVLTQ
jgi:ParB-like chromosome segregation protein Spo0J